jgi:hypothetical protein
MRPLRLMARVRSCPRKTVAASGQDLRAFTGTYRDCLLGKGLKRSPLSSAGMCSDPASSPKGVWPVGPNQVIEQVGTRRAGDGVASVLGVVHRMGWSA